MKWADIHNFNGISKIYNHYSKHYSHEEGSKIKKVIPNKMLTFAKELWAKNAQDLHISFEQINK